MKKLILIFFTFILVNTSYSQFVYLKGSDSLLIVKINEYRKSKNIEATEFSKSQNALLIKKLEWMARQDAVSHSDPWNIFEGSAKLMAKEKSTPDTAVRYSQSGECLALNYIEVPFKDTLHVESYIQARIDSS